MDAEDHNISFDIWIENFYSVMIDVRTVIGWHALSEEEYLKRKKMKKYEARQSIKNKDTFFT